jgi:hypothetical protein
MKEIARVYFKSRSKKKNFLKLLLFFFNALPRPKKREKLGKEEARKIKITLITIFFFEKEEDTTKLMQVMDTFMD